MRTCLAHIGADENEKIRDGKESRIKSETRKMLMKQVRMGEQAARVKMWIGGSAIATMNNLLNCTRLLDICTQFRASHQLLNEFINRGREPIDPKVSYQTNKRAYLFTTVIACHLNIKNFIIISHPQSNRNANNGDGQV
jgi:hypothetical protein